MKTKVHIVGGGLAGSEAAFQLAQAGIEVHLHEMRPLKMTEAHHTENCAELVCSNSLKSKAPQSAPGILKAEMRHLQSLILRVADEFAVPGGEALTVDRELFSKKITETLKAHPQITIHSEEVSEPFTDAPTLIATGPLTSEPMCQWLLKNTGETDLYFYDAIAPIVDASSLDRTKIFLANRYDKGEEEAYLNCPFTEAEYNAFIDALISAEKVVPKSFEKEKFFQGCQPIEAIAETGRESLRFGPMKPVGLTDPRSGKRPHAVVQLRPENRALTAYNLVGFQTKLKYGEQQKVFRMIPGLETIEFLRMGSIHRNTYVCGPKVLRPDLSLRKHPQVYLAGQITGVEGYLESTACGMLAAIFIEQRLKGLPHSTPPLTTALGSLLRHIISGDPENYQPNNINFGLFDQGLYLGTQGVPKDQIRARMAEQSLSDFKGWFRSTSSDSARW